MDKHRFFRQHQGLRYLSDADRYLSAAASPVLRFAFVGCGIMGQEHIRNTLLEGRAAVAGLYDPNPHSVDTAMHLLRQGQSPRVYATLDELCNDSTIDAVFIATPNFTHLDVLRQVMSSGKAIFLEKPIATTLQDAAEICRLGEQYPALLQIGLQYRYKAVYREAQQEVLERNSVGGVKSVAMQEHRFPFLDKVGQWNKFDCYTGGTLVEKCCHYFDLINLFAGARPERVFATGRQAVNFRDFNYDNNAADGLDSANVIIDYANGVMGTFSLCMHVPGSYEELVVCGDAGRLQATEQARLGEEVRNRLVLWAEDHAVSRDTEPRYPRMIERAGHHGSTFQEHVLFVDGILGEGVATPSLDEAFWSVLVAAAAQESIETGVPCNVADVLPANYPHSPAGERGESE
ncbi:MAG: Gfo/Idh/MocA family oxidoreductase [Pseudomonadota bacterium]